MATHPAIIAEAFPAVTVARNEIDGIPPESRYYRNDMGGKHWAEVSRKVYESHTDALILMSPDTLKHFIAGYLSVAFTDTFSNSADSLIYATSHGDHLAALCETLAQNQIDCLFDVIEHVYLDSCGDQDDHEFSLIRELRAEMIRLNESRG